MCAVLFLLLTKPKCRLDGMHFVCVHRRDLAMREGEDVAGGMGGTQAVG